MTTEFIEGLLYTITGIPILIYQMINFLKDDRSPNYTDQDLKLKKRWHWATGALHLWIATAISDMYTWEWGLVFLSVLWVLFDGFINIKVLNKKWWEIGTTAWLDKTQRSIASWLKTPPETVSATLKCITVAGSILNLIFNK